MRRAIAQLHCDCGAVTQPAWLRTEFACASRPPRNTTSVA